MPSLALTVAESSPPPSTAPPASGTFPPTSARATISSTSPSFSTAATRSTTPAPAAPEGFVLEEEIGRGGMGVVYRARDAKLPRDLAVKVLLSDSPRLRRRFFEEVKIAGQLAHPGVAPVHDVGTLADGRPYFT